MRWSCCIFRSHRGASSERGVDSACAHGWKRTQTWVGGTGEKRARGKWRNSRTMGRCDTSTANVDSPSAIDFPRLIAAHLRCHWYWPRMATPAAYKADRIRRQQTETRLNQNTKQNQKQVIGTGGYCLLFPSVEGSSFCPSSLSGSGGFAKQARGFRRAVSGFGGVFDSFTG